MSKFVICIPAVTIPYSFGFGLVYRNPAEGHHLARGSCIWLPYGKKTVPGVVWDETVEPSGYHVKEIGPPLGWSLTAQCLLWIDLMSRNTLQSLSSIIELTLPRFLFSGSSVHSKVLPPIRSHISSSRTSENFNITHTLHWLDPHGQAEEVEQALRSTIDLHPGQHLILVPTEGDIERWTHLGSPYHGSMSPSMKRSLWSSIATRTPRIVIGTPASLFLPWTDLQSIHILREHDSSFIHAFQSPSYDGRDAALLLSHAWQIPISSYSATPRMASYYATTA